MKRFYFNNRDVFLKYFDDSTQFTALEIYNALVESGNYARIDQIIKEKSKTLQEKINDTQRNLSSQNSEESVRGIGELLREISQQISKSSTAA